MDVSTLKEKFLCDGYVVFENAIRPEYLQTLQETVEDGAKFGGGRNLLAHSPVFDELIDGHTGMELLEALIPDLQLLAMDLRTCPPGGGDMVWHTDGVLWSQQTLTVNTALYLDELTPDNGALRVVPGSHKRPFDLEKERLHDFLDSEVKVLCPPGTVVVFDDCLWHRTGNNTTEKARRGIFTYYGHFWIKPTSYQERPETFASMRRLWEGKGDKRRQLLGIERKNSEFNHPLAWETEK
jgi:hypothetical protein